MTGDIGHVVVVGGGPGGIMVARTIVKAAGGTVRITIVDRQSYLDWSLSSPRMLADPGSISEMGYVMPLDKVVEFISGKDGNIKIVQAAVKKIAPKCVVLDDGTTLEADAIVVAVGGQYRSGAMWKPTPDQTTREARIAGFRALHAEVATAKHVLVAGCGPTGVEVAGEVKSAFPDAKVTIVGSMLPNSPPSLRARMKVALEGMGVVVKEGRVDTTTGPKSDGRIVTREGEAIEGVDFVLNAAGFAFSGDELADDSLKKDVTNRGQFDCRPTLQLKSFDEVFCCGDVLAVPEGRFADVKGLNHADLTGETVGKNVVSFLQKKPLEPFNWSKKPIQSPMMTALGPSDAVGYVGLPNFIEDFMARFFKCKDYYMSIKGSSYGKGKTWN